MMLAPIREHPLAEPAAPDVDDAPGNVGVRNEKITLELPREGLT
jgi:hypothetical protein